jgi:hypothetical protein
VLNTCKSNAQFFRRKAEGWARGERVRNTWITFLQVGNNPVKIGLIPHNIARAHALAFKPARGRKRDPRPIS